MRDSRCVTKVLAGPCLQTDAPKRVLSRGSICHYFNIVTSPFHGMNVRLARVEVSHSQFIRWCKRLAVLLALTLTTAGEKLPPSVEFGTPYQLRIISDGTVLELSGSISWAVPQNLQVMLAESPNVRLIRLDSPGGYIKSALAVADVIQQRGLDTYVGRLCASACTLIFLSGRQHWLGTNARLGFHQGHGPGISPTQVDPLLRQAYEHLGVPEPFIAHVLRTPPDDLWVPTQDELLKAGLVTKASPPAVIRFENAQPQQPDLHDVPLLLQSAPDEAVIAFASTLSDLIKQVQDVNPEACWALTHKDAATQPSALPQGIREAVSVAIQHFAASARPAGDYVLSGAERRAVAQEIFRVIKAKGQAAILEGLRPNAEHSTFCPALREVLATALALPAAHRAQALRAVLAGW
jgi:hypothetical protein